jgi:AraC-like DNA-binding protein
MLYFFALSALRHEAELPAYAADVFNNRIRHALTGCQRQSDNPNGTPKHHMHCMQAEADILLAMDWHEEAESLLQKAQRHFVHSRDELRLLSCRNAGWQALFHRRFGTAQSCLNRICEDGHASDRDRIEAWVGLAYSHHALGQQVLAEAAMHKVMQCVEDFPDDRMRLVTEAIALEIKVKHYLRQAHGLNDHIFWRQPNHHVHAACSAASLTQMLGNLLQQASGMPLLEGQINLLLSLIRLSGADRAVIPFLKTHMEWATEEGLSAYVRQTRLEMVLASLSANMPDYAEQIMAHIRDAAQTHVVRRWDIEHAYCLAKLTEQQGRTTESLQLYRKYACDAMECLRVEICAQIKPAYSTAAPSYDDIEVRLPAKYRRAYRYIVNHLSERNLCIREVAAEIGVTERALQSVFRSHLGISPTELIRRCRMERIRADLLSPTTKMTSIFEAAQRWGIFNRSTLASAYRSYFKETPNETLMRA